MKLAAIDIGSNAARIQISKVIPRESDSPFFKKIEYIRFPLQLGKDVFQTGRIEEKKRTQFLKLMHVFRHIMDLHEVEGYCAYATSALREAQNSTEIVQQILEETGLTLEVIDGHKEAIITNYALSQYFNDETVIHIDVGGGSTELNIHHQGEKTLSKSFQVGSVRTLSSHDSVWSEISNWVQSQSINYSFSHAIGTGGNISKLHQIIRSGDNIPSEFLTQYQILCLKSQLEPLSFEELVAQYNLNPDRADVIVPASKIYLHVMKVAQVHSIRVPKVGLKDGILKMLYQQMQINV